MLKRKFSMKIVVEVPLPNYNGGKPRHQRYHLARRGKIARLLKPKPKSS